MCATYEADMKMIIRNKPPPHQQGRMKKNSSASGRVGGESKKIKTEIVYVLPSNYAPI